MRKAKIKIKVLLRASRDFFSGMRFRFSRHGNAELCHAISLELEVKPSETFENKLYNLRLASEKINQYLILPNQVFSFWHIIKNPENGFKKGRSIINGQMGEETGGGLCQVSGIIYYVSLIGGLDILERHNHSVDIYNEQTRFTPLGTDATVVYGYKDLRVRNPFDFPVRFHLEITGNVLKVHLLSAEKIPEKALSIAICTIGETTLATVSDENNAVLNVSKYRKSAI